MRDLITAVSITLALTILLAISAAGFYTLECALHHVAH